MNKKQTLKLNMHINEYVIKHTKKQFDKINKTNIILILKKLKFAEQKGCEVVDISDIELSDYIINRNKKRISNVNGKLIINEHFRKELFSDVLDILQKTESINIKDIEDENDEDWVNKNTDGKYEVNEYTTYNKIDKFTQDNGDDTDFLYRFNKKSNIEIYEETDELQVIELDIVSNGELTTIPIQYFYECYKCRERGEIKPYYKKPYEVASSLGGKINCQHKYLVDNEKYKTCNALLEPIKTRQKTKDVMIYDAVATTKIDDEFVKKKFKVISYKYIPVGPLISAIVKIPNSFGEHMIFLLDYKIEKYDNFKIDIDKTKHNIFNIIDNIEKHIFKIEGYKHYGYLPMKIASIIQYCASIFQNIGKNYHIALTGGASTGKTAFSQYWGATLYGNKLLDIANVSDISIPSLRGSVETINLFNNKVQQRTDGHLNTKDLIIINELSSDSLMKQAMKGHLFNSEYTFSKVGGDTIPRTRNAQFIITENINPDHVGRYKNTVKKFYQSEECRIHDKEIIKPVWNENWDLELPINHEEYANNPYLRLAIYNVRKKLENENKNWIDGDEIASDDRFIFYFFVSNIKSNPNMEKCLLDNEENVKNNPKTSMLIRRLYTKTFEDFISNKKEFLNCEVKNEREYFKKLFDIIKEYDPRSSIRY